MEPAPATSRDHASIHLQRFSGVDAFRILCTYGVVILHSGFNHEYHVSPAASSLQDFFGFAVPTFLALSFLLQVLRNKDGKFAFYTRCMRLMIPYLLWSALHLAARAAKYEMQHQPAKIHDLLADPLAILCFGAASVQLYFLPLLFVGGCLCAGISRPLQNTATPWLVVLLVLTAFANHLIVVSGNDFDLSAGRAFQNLAPPIAAHPIIDQVARVVLVCFSWSARCLPYIIGIFLMVRLGTITLFTASWLPILGCLLLGISILIPLPAGTGEYVSGLSATLTALAISSKLPSHPLVRTMATFTFGVFLLHDLVLEGLEFIFKQFGMPQVSLVQLVVISFAAFFLSTLVVWLGSRGGSLCRTLFAMG